MVARIRQVDADVVQRIAVRVDRRLEHEAVKDRLADRGILEVVGHGQGRVQARCFLLLPLGEAPLVEDAQQGLQHEVVRVHELVQVREVCRHK
jgi:hypothetical protein